MNKKEVKQLNEYIDAEFRNIYENSKLPKTLRQKVKHWRDYALSLEAILCDVQAELEAFS